MKQNQQYVGLTDAQVEESRQKYGSNILTSAEKVPVWKRFLEKFKDPIILILLVAGLASVAIALYEYFSLGHGSKVFFEPVGIFIAIFLATGLAFIFELKAEREFAILNQVNDDEPVEVIRNGKPTQIAKKDVVVGDIVVINTGQEIPADGQLLEAVSLNVDESTLTGEPLCHKSIDESEFDEDATFPTNHVMRGTKVMEGHGVFEVRTVGDATENGKVFEASQIDDSVKTPLNEQLDGLGKLLTKISYTIAVLVLISRIGLFLANHSFELMSFVAYFLQSLMIAVTIVVVSIPEGLPMAVTLSLAYSMRRMMKTNNLVRKLHACETMGATTVICTDKTGTLTQNQMRIHETRFFGLEDQRLQDDERSLLIKEGIAVNSTATLDYAQPSHPSAIGNPTEGALLLWLNSVNEDYMTLRTQARVVDQLPFSTERKYMATVVESALMPGKKVVYVKGAPEMIYPLCRQIDQNVSVDEINQQLLQYQGQAMRTLGFAYQILENDSSVFTDGKLSADNLTFLGVVAIADPVRSDVPEAVRQCIDAGIQVKIVTGDTPGTAKEIGRQIGLWTDGDTEKNIITGPEFAALSDEELYERIGDFKIIARARPMDKKRLVETLQLKNEVVAVTGDGTNDAPALKAAHVGLSMGDGTSVAKEASAITILDNSFYSIGKAVMWGRSLYKNIQRFILFQMTVNVAACLLVLAGAFMGTESPLTVTQMLWVNLIMDTFAAMALASLPPSERVMKEKPRDRNDFIINRYMKYNIIGTGIAFFLILVGLVYVFEHSSVTQLTDLLTIRLGEENSLEPYELSLIFTIFVMLQFWNMFNARAYQTGRSALHFKGCQELGMIAVLIVVGQILIVEFGGAMFNVTPLSVQDWVIIICGTSVVLWIGELFRVVFRSRQA